MSDLPSVLVCPDKFRGTLSAPAAARAIAAGLGAAGFSDIVELPLADGGEGTLEALLAAGGDIIETQVTGPDRRPVAARWGLRPDGVAVVEMAQASGLALVRGENDPLTATTYGTGELIALAAAGGARAAIVGVGGSATVDGGLGALEALGWRLPLPVVVACDVTTRFAEAARIFGPQKGASPRQVELLTERLELFAVRLRERTGVDVRELSGAGAAGGLAGGLAALRATLRPGFDVVAEAVGFEALLRRASLVVTGEGRLDHTSLSGKVVGEVLRAAREYGIPAAVVAGEIARAVVLELPADVQAMSLVDLATSAEDARARASELLTQAASQVVRPGTG